MEARRILRFGVFELDVQSGELRKQGIKVRLADQPCQILLLLLDRPDEVVSREELQKKLWPADTFVDFDVGLSSAVRKLRDALGDSAENPQFIETIPKRGYRFIAPVKSATPDLAPPPASRPATSRVGWLGIGGGLALAAMIAVIVLYQRGSWDRLRGATPAGSIKSIAVLPFDNLTGDPGQGYFVDGMTDGLTTNLAQVDGLQVISRASAMRYREPRKPLPQIGRELTVDALVLGAVVRSGERLRISAQLVDAATDRHVWAHSYDGEIRDAVVLQSEIASAIAHAVNAGGDDSKSLHLPLRRQVKPEAYDLYLKGVSLEGRSTYEGFRNAVAYFEDAVAQQPDFAIGYAALANAQLQFLYGGPLSPRETVPKAEAAARKALELDDTLPQAHRALGAILHNYYWQWAEGDKEMRRAAELHRNSVEAHTAAATALIRSNRFEDALAEAERARRLDPLSLTVAMNVAAAFRAAGQYDRAMEGFRRALAIDPQSGRVHFQIGVTFLFMHRLKDAIQELETADLPRGRNTRFEAYLAYAYAAAGRRADALKIVADLQARGRQQYVSSFGIALVYDALGEKEPAMAALERAYEEHAVEFSQPAQYAPFQSLQTDPRFQSLMSRVGRNR